MSDAAKTLTIKPSPEAQVRVARLVKRTGMPRHAILLRLLNLGLAQAEKDYTALFSPDAMGPESDSDTTNQIGILEATAA